MLVREANAGQGSDGAGGERETGAQGAASGELSGRCRAGRGREGEQGGATATKMHATGQSWYRRRSPEIVAAAAQRQTRNRYAATGERTGRGGVRAARGMWGRAKHANRSALSQRIALQAARAGRQEAGRHLHDRARPRRAAPVSAGQGAASARHTTGNEQGEEQRGRGASPAGTGNRPALGRLPASLPPPCARAGLTAPLHSLRLHFQSASSRT